MALQHAAKFLASIKYKHPSFLSRNCQIRYGSLFTNLQKLKATQRVEENKLVEKLTTTEHEEVKIEDVKSNAESVGAVSKIHRRFPKSSTQNAVTSCLKPSRLASPFPEPVKMILSHETVSDDEKSRRMAEEVKLEARYVLQQQQEKLLQENLRRKSNVPENASGSEDLLNKDKQPCIEKEMKCEYKNELEEMYYNNSKKTYSANSENNTNRRSSGKNKKCQNQTEEVERNNKITQEAEPVKIETKKGRRGRTRTRSSRLLRSSKKVGTAQDRNCRKYSTFSNYSPLTEPAFLSHSEQINTLLNQLRLLDPKYKQIKKPLFFPGSEEEKKFYRMILKLISEHKHESKRQSAPYPSYSEVKTYACEVKTKAYEPTQSKNNTEPLLGKPNIRSYSTAATTDTSFRTKFDTRPNYDHRRKLLQKLRREFLTKIESYKKSITNFSAATLLMKDDEKKEIVEMKEKKPCECPYPNIPICDYEEVARANKERRKSRGRKPCVDGCPNSCDPCPCNPCHPCPCPCPCNPCNPCRKCCTMPFEGLNENQNVVNRIKEWLNTWKPESKYIKISKCTTGAEIQDRETYVIEINECADGNIKDEQLKSELLHIPNMGDDTICDNFQVEIPSEFSGTDNIIINNIPDYVSFASFKSDDLDSDMLDTNENSTPTLVQKSCSTNVLKDAKLLPDAKTNMVNVSQPKQKSESAKLEETKPVSKEMANDLDLDLLENKQIQKKMVADINNILKGNKSVQNLEGSKLKQKKMVADINNILEGNKSVQNLEGSKLKQKKMVPFANNILDVGKQIKTTNLNSIMREAENIYFDDNKRNNENFRMVEKKKNIKLTDKIVEQVKVFNPIDSFVEYDSNVLIRQDNKYINKPKTEHFKLKTEFWRK